MTGLATGSEQPDRGGAGRFDRRLSRYRIGLRHHRVNRHRDACLAASGKPVFFVNSLTGQVVGGPPGQGHALFAAGPKTYEIMPHLSAGQVGQVVPGGVVYSTAQFAPADSVVVAHNRIANSYLARGIAFSGVAGIEITGNTITNTQQAGIFLGTAPPQYGPVNGALIADNTLTATNMGMSGVGTDMLSAIEVMAFGSNGNVFGGQPSRKLFINRNTITTTERTGIWVGNVADGESILRT